MLDIKYVRENSDLVQKNAQNKNIDVDINKLLDVDSSRRELTTKAEGLRAERNELSSKMSGSKPSGSDIEKSKKLKESLKNIEAKLTETEKEYVELLRRVPNMSSEDTPVGSSEDENQVLYEKGEKPKFDFQPKNHWEIALSRGWIDKERAAKVSGARFAYLRGNLVKLQLALMQYTIDKLTDEKIIAGIITKAGLEGLSTKPFTPIFPPYMIRTKMFEAMDRLEPSEDRYKIEGEELWLQGSAEHVLGSMHAGETFNEDDLPLRYLGYATSFRKEAGNYGKDMEGIIRMHQFDKLEMEIIADANSGMEEHLLTIAIQEYLLADIGLPYRKLLKCTADIGKPNFRGVDMDVWLPGQGKYRETHTADFMTDYQARRLATKVKKEGQTEYVHTIDATTFALGRTMVGIIENNQTEDGKVLIPKVLQKYMGGVEKI